MSKPDWSGGPIGCRVCGTPMRPVTRKAVGQWEGTVVHHSRGACRHCWQSGVVEAADEPGPIRMVWRWRLLDAPVPLLHQEYEAIADLMDHLRDAGYVLVGRPARRQVIHGADPTLVMDCAIRLMTEAEERALEHERTAA